MKPKKIGSRQWWKYAFFLLLSLQVALGLVLASRILTPREETSQIAAPPTSDTKIGSFTTSRDQLNETIATYLKKYQTEKISYKIYSTSQLVLFEGNYQFLGASIPLLVYFQPSRLEDGSILLTVTEISAGSLSLPPSQIMTYIEKNYPLPDFVQLNAEEATAQIHLSAIKNDLGFYVKANTIDLYNDELIFDIYQAR